MVEQNLATLK